MAEQTNGPWSVSSLGAVSRLDLLGQGQTLSYDGKPVVVLSKEGLFLLDPALLEEASQEGPESMMSKRYTLEQGSWWADQGCDCCEPAKMEIWTVKDDEGNEVHTNGTPYSLETAYAYLLEKLGFDVEVKYQDGEDC